MDQHTYEAQNFRQLMREVKMGDTSTDNAAARIEAYVVAEVARRCAPDPNMMIALHPLDIVQNCADRLEKGYAPIEERMVARLMREYAMLRRRMEDARLRASAESPAIPKLPPRLLSVEQQLFQAMREMSQFKWDKPEPPEPPL